MSLAIDHDELDMAMVLLGVVTNVDIYFVAPSGGRAGEYVGVPEGRSSHVVNVHPDLDASTANRVTWHELAHCMQAERCAKKGLNFGLEYDRTMQHSGLIDPDLHDGIGDVDITRDEETIGTYRSTPFEFEADLLAARYAATHAVIIPQGS